MTDERRQHPRVPAGGPCTIVDQEGIERPFELVDLSESGARLQCSVAIGAMTRIHVAMRLPADRVEAPEDVALETVGVIVWSHRIRDGVYDTGVFFPELDEASAKLLQSYVATAA